MTEIPREDAAQDAPEPAVAAAAEARPPGDRVPTWLLFVFFVIPLFGILAALLMVAAEPPAQGGVAVEGASVPDTVYFSLVNKPAPDFELPLLDGGQARLSDFLGRPVLLNFWQTTCPPCVRELPEFAAFAAGQGADGAVVLAVNMEEAAPDVRAFLDSLDLGAQLTVPLDENGDVRTQYGVVGIPVTYLVGVDGTILTMKLGEMDRDEMEDYLALAREMALTAGGA
jgi:peroxiredoxin